MRSLAVCVVLLAALSSQGTAQSAGTVSVPQTVRGTLEPGDRPFPGMSPEVRADEWRLDLRSSQQVQIRFRSDEMAALVVSRGPSRPGSCPAPCAMASAPADQTGGLFFGAGAAGAYTVTIVGRPGSYWIDTWPRRTNGIWSENVRVGEQWLGSFQAMDPHHGADKVHDYVITPDFTGELRIDLERQTPRSGLLPIVEFGTGRLGDFRGTEVLRDDRSVFVRVAAGRRYTIRVRSAGAERQTSYRLVTCRRGEEAPAGICSASQISWRTRGESDS